MSGATTTPLLTGHMVNEPVDADDPDGDILIYESDMGPLGLRLDGMEHRRRKRDARRDNAGREPVPLAVRSPHAAAQAARQEHDATGTRQIIDEKKTRHPRKDGGFSHTNRKVCRYWRLSIIQIFRFSDYRLFNYSGRDYRNASRRPFHDLDSVWTFRQSPPSRFSTPGRRRFLRSTKTCVSEGHFLFSRVFHCTMLLRIILNKRE